MADDLSGRDRLKGIVPLILLGIFLAGTGWIQPRLFRARAKQNPLAATPIENTTPLVAFTTVALGGFSGLLVDILWARITLLQDKGEYLEIVQLSNLITQLEPRLAAVWDYHSFNLAYNVTAMCSDPVERWRWIKSGISLLRDRGLVYNPDYLMLYDRLARLYKHKLIDVDDPAHPYYQLAFAREMDAVTDNGAVPADESRIARLKSECRLDITTMKDIDRLYGPLDWRLPEAHIIYWAHLGRLRAKAGRDLGFDYMICNAMADAVCDGRITSWPPALQELETGPNWDLLPRAERVFSTAMTTHVFGIDKESPLSGPYKKFLRDTLVLSYEQGLTSQAETLFNTLKNAVRDPETTRSLQDYVTWLKGHPVDNPAGYEQKIYSHDCSTHEQGDHNH